MPKTCSRSRHSSSWLASTLSDRHPSSPDAHDRGHPGCRPRLVHYLRGGVPGHTTRMMRERDPDRGIALLLPAFLVGPLQVGAQDRARFGFQELFLDLATLMRGNVTWMRSRLPGEAANSHAGRRSHPLASLQGDADESVVARPCWHTPINTGEQLTHLSWAGITQAASKGQSRSSEAMYAWRA